MSKIRTGRAEVPGTLISDYVYRAPSQPRELIVMLHGYSLTGKIVFDKFESCCPADVAVLSPNAPFPIPERKADGSYKVGFSWYFYNPASDEYYIDMKVSLELLEGLIQKLGLEKLPKRIIGFSQGGYLAPFVALKLANVRQVIGVAAEYLPEEIDDALKAQGQTGPLPFRCDAVHGERDDVVSPEDARKAHQAMLSRGAQGRFVGLASEGHRLSPAIVDSVKDLLDQHVGLHDQR